MSTMQVLGLLVLVLAAVRMLLLVVLVALRIPVLHAAAWHLYLKIIGVSKAERRRLAVAAARRDLNLGGPA